MLDEAKGISYGMIEALFASLQSILANYLEYYLDASVGQILIMSEVSPLIMIGLYIIIQKDARDKFKESLDSLLIILNSENVNINSNIDRNLNELELSRIRAYYSALFWRSVIGAISSSLYFWSMIKIDSAGNIMALDKICILLFSAFLSYITLSIPPSIFTLIIILPLSILGIIFICQPPLLFNLTNSNSSNSSDGISWIGACILISSGITRAIANVIVKKNRHIPWYIVDFYVSLVGAIVSSVIVLGEYFSGVSPLWSVFECDEKNVNINESSSECKQYYGIWLSNFLCLLFGLITFPAMLFRTLSFPIGHFIYVSTIYTGGSILLTYLFEKIFFNTKLNYLTYIGMCLIVISSIMINYQIYLNTQIESTNGNLSVAQNSQNSQNSQSPHFKPLNKDDNDDDDYDDDDDDEEYDTIDSQPEMND